MKTCLPQREALKKDNMPYSLIWLPQVLKDAGLKVALVDGWEDRGHGDVRTIHGVICHHTATNEKRGNMPTLNTLIHGRNDLPGPLAQIGLGRDGTYYIIAAGRSYHAGAGIWKGLTNGNSNFIGIEAENTGRANDFPWPAVQQDAYHRGVAAILKHIGRSAAFCAAHKEYALPKGRKPDPTFDMISFRSAVAAILNDPDHRPALIPAVEPISPLGAPGRPTLRRGASGELVKLIQIKIKVAADGTFGTKTEAALRVFQRENNLVADGIVGPKTWITLDAAAGA
jgi:peptidoglycan hydrolase-like protein with peptidoglycan-binding domain